MSDELIDIVDDNNLPTGKQAMKSEAHRLGLWHRAAHIWIYHKQNGILLQHRAKEKKLYPDVWDVSVGGHVSAGEEPALSATREAAEELGLITSPEKLSFVKIVKTQILYQDLKNNEFIYVYFLPFEGQLTNLKIQTEELQAIKFFPLAELMGEFKKNPGQFIDQHINGGKYWSEILKKLAHDHFQD